MILRNRSNTKNISPHLTDCFLCLQLEFYYNIFRFDYILHDVSFNTVFKSLFSQKHSQHLRIFNKHISELWIHNRIHNSFFKYPSSYSLLWNLILILNCEVIEHRPSWFEFFRSLNNRIPIKELIFHDWIALNILKLKFHLFVGFLLGSLWGWWYWREGRCVILKV